MIKSSLIIVPHQDDELNISGFVLEEFVRRNIKVNILYVTRGDYYKNKYVWRQRERDKVLEIFGSIEYKQLDYGDNYNFANHIFNDSQLRESVETDIYDYILRCKSDLIICIDYDLHADHRMVSCLFDRAMCRILKENIYYRPIVLKKFAYLGVWHGENDFFSENPKCTCADICNENEKVYFASLPNSWEDRICVKTKENDYSPTKFWKSKIFKAYKNYWTQCGYKFFFKAANADIIYWFRNTRNLMLQADVFASSGNPTYVNDFAIGNIDSITEKFKEVEEKFPNSAWITTDKKREIVIKWNKKVKIRSLKLYQNFKKLGHINEFQIIDEMGQCNICRCGKDDIEYFHFEKEVVTDNIRLQILDATGMAGIRELEFYEENGEFPWDECPFEEYVKKELEYSRAKIQLMEKIEMIIWTELRLRNKVRKCLGLSYWGN